MLSMVIGLLSICPLSANAAWTIDYEPYAKVENNYSSDVYCGTIRYISQITSATYFYSAYWPSGPFGGYSSPGTECGTASISMALSYVGINKTPKTILETNNGYTYFTGWGADTSSPSVSTGMSNYISGNGAYSPVIIHLPNYSSAGHWVVLVAKVSSNVYKVLDPANSNLWNITINGTSATYTKNGSTINDTIDRTYQYYNADANIVGPHDHDRGTFKFYEGAHPHVNCYECSICGTIWRDTSSSNYLTSCVECNRPSKPAFKGLKSTYTTKDTITFEWDPTTHTTHYNFVLWIKDPNGEWEDEYGNWEIHTRKYYANSGINMTLEPGQYRAMVESKNSDYYEEDGSDWVHTLSDYYYFTVEAVHEHSYSETVTPPTCTERGYTTHTLLALSIMTMPKTEPNRPTAVV